MFDETDSTEKLADNALHEVNFELYCSLSAFKL